MTYALWIVQGLLALLPSVTIVGGAPSVRSGRWRQGYHSPTSVRQRVS